MNKDRYQNKDLRMVLTFKYKIDLNKK